VKPEELGEVHEVRTDCVTCTPVTATSAATLRASIVAPALAAEYRGAPGVGRAADALVITNT